MIFLLIATAIPSGYALISDRSVAEDVAEPETRIEPVVAENPDFSSYSQTIVGTDVTIEMIPVEGGTFLMGRSAGEDGKQPHEGPQRKVSVDSFWMASHAITWDQFELFTSEVIEREIKEINEEIMDRFGIEVDAITAPSPPWGDKTFGMGREGKPAISMTHYAAVVYTMWLTAKTGEFYRLPTEAEWEYACRGGSAGNYHFGGDAYVLDKYEWYRNNSADSYNRVAEKKPNPLGLYDMKGNVAEWTMDEYHEDYHEKLEGEVADNPWFRPDVLYPRAVRGGSWRDSVEDIRSTHRRGSDQRWSRGDPQLPRSMWWHTDAPFVGFRIIRPKETPSTEEIMKYWIEPMLDI